MQGDFSSVNGAPVDRAPADSAIVDRALVGRAPTVYAYADDTPADAVPVNGSLIYHKRSELTQEYEIWHLLILLFYIKWRHCRCCTL